MRSWLNPSPVTGAALLAIALTIGLSTISYSQEENPLDVKVVPPGPEAAALGKYIDMPVSTYTGVPNISIPIYELKSYQLAIPISLSYHASGIKMEEISSFVGAGWSLNAGGMVSRTMRGLDDENITGYLSTTPLENYFEVDPFFTSTGEINSAYLGQHANTNIPETCDDVNGYNNVLYASRGGLDLEPDLFFFSLPDGQSAKFLYNREGEIQVIPKQYVDIEYTLRPVTDQPFYTFMITGKDGTKYFFEDREASLVNSSCDVPETYDEGGQPVRTPPQISATSTWKLTRMETASGSDWIDFEYESETLTYELPASVSFHNRIGISDMATPPTSVCTQGTSVGSWRLKAIKTRAGYEAHFYAGTERTDVEGGYALDSIRIQYQSAEIKTIRLQHHYAAGLMLSSAGEFKGGKAIAPAHTFEYYDGDGVHDRNSFAVDHWGYSNGATGNFLKVPAVINNNFYYSGADRRPNLEYCREWSLKKITYPTGGTTEYEYELHDYSNIQDGNAITYAPGIEELASIEFQYTNNIADDYYGTDSFTLTDTVNVVFEYAIPLVDDGGIPIEGCEGLLTRSASLYSHEFMSGTGSGLGQVPIVQLLPGTYTLTAEFDPDQFSWPEIAFNSQPFYIKIYKVLSQAELRSTNDMKGGGLRIKKITSTGDQVLTKTYSYNYREGDSISSGKLMSFPLYAYITDMREDVWDESNASCLTAYQGVFMTRSVTSAYPLSQSSGSYVSYDEVTEYIGDDEENNGYSVYRYHNFPDEQSMGSYPITPRNSYTYKNGLLKEQLDFTKDNRIVQRTQNSYNFSGYEEICPAIKIVQRSTTCKGCPNRVFRFNTYTHPTELIRLEESAVTVWGTRGDTQEETVSTYTYDSYDQVISTHQTGSTPENSFATNIAYHDVNHTAPIEEYTAQYYGLDETIIKGKQIVYDATGNIPLELWLAETDELVRTTPVNDIFEKRLEYEVVTPQGRIRQYKKTGDATSVTVIWGYGVNRDLFPIAQVINADTASVAYTSFENTARDGGWKFGGIPNSGSAVTGSNRYAALNSAAVETAYTRSAGTYIISYWANSSSVAITDANNNSLSPVDHLPPVTQGSYTLYTKRIVLATPLKIKLSSATYVNIDELRLYPLGAQMTTYTYDVTTGMTSATDPNVITSYYVYDGSNRLLYLKDFEGNILKRFEYHYERNND